MNFSRIAIANQGEIRIDRIEGVEADMSLEALEPTNPKGFVVSHSEQGNHHILTAPGVTVMERTKELDGRPVPASLKILQVIVSNPEGAKLFQDALVPHKTVELRDPGLYEFRIKREFDPFQEQVRRVAD